MKKKPIEKEKAEYDEDERREMLDLTSLSYELLGQTTSKRNKK